MLDSSSYPGNSRKASDSDLSPPRHKQSLGRQDSDSDLSPPRNRPRHRSSDSDLSPPRRKQRAKSSDSDLSPPRRSLPPGKVGSVRSHILLLGRLLSSSSMWVPELHAEEEEEEVALGSAVNLVPSISRDPPLSLKAGLPGAHPGELANTRFPN